MGTAYRVPGLSDVLLIRRGRRGAQEWPNCLATQVLRRHIAQVHWIKRTTYLTALATADILVSELADRQSHLTEADNDLEQSEHDVAAELH